MLKKLFVSALACAALSLSGCYERVNPNEYGILVENHGKDPSKDYSVVSGKVATYPIGTTLYRIPAYEQRSQFESPIINKSADGTEFSVTPRFSYRIDPKKATKVVREHSTLLSAGDGLKGVEERSLNPAVVDVVRAIIENTTSEELMKASGNAVFNTKARDNIQKAFADRGFELLSFSTILDYSSSVKKSIETRNAANSQLATLESQILKAEKEVKLAEIETTKKQKENEAITPEKIQMELINKWDGKLPETFICDNGGKSPITMMLSTNK